MNKIILLFFIIFTNLGRATEYNILQIYDIAHHSSPALKSIDAMYSAESTKTIKAKSLLLPQIDLYGQLGSKATYLDTIYQGLTGQYTLGLTINQVLFDYSAFRFQDVAEHSVKASYLNMEYRKQEFILEVAKSYFFILLAKSNLEVAQEQLKATSATLEQTKEQKILGQKNISELEQIEATLFRAEAEVVKAENLYKNSKYRMKVFIDIDNIKLANSDFNIPIFHPIPRSIDEWVKRSVRNNKKLKSVINMREATKEAINVCRGSFLPVVSFNAGYYFLLSPIYEPGFNQGLFKGKAKNINLNDIHSSSSCLYTAPNEIKPQKYSRGWVQLKKQRMQTGMIGITFSWNLFSGGSDYAKLSQAADNYTTTTYEQIETIRDIEYRTRQSYLEVISSIGRVKALEEAKITSEIAYQMLNEKYILGATPINQVLQQMQITYLNKFKLIAAKFSYIINMLQLKLDAGTLSRDDIVEVNYWLKA
ncbi:TolC family protein [Francisellaceae bacterium]|nr:TolC family protein [Francisellaceae bacterium]